MLILVFSGADIANVCNKAVLHAAWAAWHGHEYIKECNFKSVIKHVIAGLEHKSHMTGKGQASRKSIIISEI